MNPLVRPLTGVTRVSVRIGPCYSSCGTSAARPRRAARSG